MENLPTWHVLGCWSAPAGGAPMVSLSEAELRPGAGIVGDRYPASGYWAKHLANEVTLISSEALDTIAVRLQAYIPPESLRRNILLAGPHLNRWIGHSIAVGKIRIRIDRACDPCRYLESLTGHVGLKRAMSGAGGVRGTVLVGGTMTLGDSVRIQNGGSEVN